MESDESDFQKTVARFLSEGLHIRRGLTEEEYTAVCRTAWESCQATPDFAFKVLIDPLLAGENLVSHNPEEYAHWHAADALDMFRGESTEIRCALQGLINPDFSTGPSKGPVLEPEVDVPEKRRYIIGVFDVLGFSALLETAGLDAVTEQYARLIAEAVTKPAMRIHNIIQVSKTEAQSIFCVLPVQHAHFSDTILLWAPLVQHFIAPFLARCADMVCEALQMGLPLRGAVAVGRAVMHRTSGTFIGQPIVEAAKLEQAQDWLGVTLGASMLAADVACEFDPTLVVPYRVPFKRRRINFPTSLALDWPNRFRARYGIDPSESIALINRSPAHSIYYDNAQKFATYSAGPLFRSDGLRPFRFNELAQAAVTARKSHTPLTIRQNMALNDLARAGDIGASIATVIRATAAGDDLPPIPASLPRGVRSELRELSQAAEGPARYVNLNAYVFSAFIARHTHTPLHEDVQTGLDELQHLDPRGPVIAQFLRDLADGQQPALPRRFPRHTKELFKEVHAWAISGAVPDSLLKRLATECLEARINELPLDDATQLALDAVDGTGQQWSAVVSFLRAIAAGEQPDLPSTLPKELHNKFLGLQRAATPAGVQRPRTADIMAVGIGDPSTGVDLFSLSYALSALRGQTTEIPKELLEAIEVFEAGDSLRVILAQRLRAIPSGTPNEQHHDHLPIALELALAQLDAIANNDPIPLDPSLAGLAAIRSRHGGGEMGDCIRMSLHILAGGNAECRALVDYLRNVAQGRSPTPIPTLTDSELLTTAEEVRCLADPLVGGIQMMAGPAPQAEPVRGVMASAGTERRTVGSYPSKPKGYYPSCYPTAETRLYSSEVLVPEKIDAEARIVELKAQLVSNPANVETYLDLAGVYRYQGRLLDIVSCLETAISVVPPTMKVHAILSKTLRKLGRLDEALTHARVAVELAPEDARLQTLVAACLTELGKEAEAVPYFEAAARAEPENVAHHTNLRNALVATARGDNAILPAQRAVELAPDDARNTLILGVLLDDGGHEDAVRYLERATLLEPDFAFAHEVLGLHYGRAAQHEEAIACLRRALDLEETARRWELIGGSFADLDRWTDAEAAFRRAAEMEPTNAGMRTNLGFVIGNQGRLEEAAAVFEDLLREDPNNLSAARTLAELRAQMEQP